MKFHTSSSLLVAASLLLPILAQPHHADIEDHHHSPRRDLLIQGRYRTGEVVSKQLWFQPGQRLRVEWVARPAIGNCVISLFSIFNADLLFDYGTPEHLRPAWSEIAFETFGGSVGRAHRKQFQTQYISQDDPDAPPTQRGDQHVYEHYLNEIPNIYDGNFHTFEVEFLPAAPGVDAEIVYFVDGAEIRRVEGGDANYLEAPLDIYAGVWATGGDHPWACTPEDPEEERRMVRGRSLQQTTVVTDFPLQINCGGGAVAGYSADQYAVPGTSSTYALGGCNDPSCSERWGNVEYSIPVANGEYTIFLHFQEIFYQEANQRVFDVLVEDEVVAASVDPFGEGNDVTVQVTETITDGFIDIRLQSVIENAKISSIVVVEGSAPLPAPTFPIRINCGGRAIAGYAADQYAVGGNTYVTNGCNDPSCSERYGPLEYVIPVPSGDYAITASFTEVFYTTEGSRVFDVYIEDSLEADNLDPVAEGGSVDITVQATVQDGFVNIRLASVQENPKISSITITPLSDGGVPITPAPTTMPEPNSPTSTPTMAPTQPLTYADRPDQAQVVVQSIKVFEQTTGQQWTQRRNYQFRHGGDLYGDWNLSNWGFDAFDGAFDPSAVRVANNELYLDLVRN